jgi:hypothetical protein
MLMEATDLPLALALEGGYGPSLGRAIAAIFRALGRKSLDEHPDAPPGHSTRELVRILKRVSGW